MIFKREVLEFFEAYEEDIGYWNGTRVKVISKKNLKKTIPRLYYVIYDDRNLLYKAGYVYGVVGDKGKVREFEKPVRYGKWF